MDTKLLELILICVLLFEGIGGKRTFLYLRPGDDAVLPCRSASSCSIVSWLYNRNTEETLYDVKDGVTTSSLRVGRLSLNMNCSLVIRNINAEDVGLFTCRQRGVTDYDVATYLSVLTISPSPPGADGEVTLECSLLRYDRRPSCQQSSFSWLDETGSVLPGQGVGQMTCVSRLTVKLSGNSRRYTCQFVNKDVKIQDHYPPVSTDSLAQTYIIIIIIGVAVGLLLLLLLLIAAVLFICRKRAKVTEDVQKTTKRPEEPESSLTYVTLSHSQQCPPHTKLKEEVTYSAVKAPVKAAADGDPSSFYSCVTINQRT